MLHFFILLLVITPLFKLFVAWSSPGLLKDLEGKKGRRMLERHFGRAQRDPLVDAIGQKLVADTEHEVRFFVLDGPLINAVSLPHGEIFIWRGLLGQTRHDPNMLSAVLAHEVGHLVKQHYLQRVGRVALAQFAIGIIARPFLGVLSRNILYTIIDRGFSRAQEREADDAALQLMWDAGYEPGGLVALLDHLGALGASSGMLGTHPSPRERSDRLRRRISRMGWQTEIPEVSDGRKIVPFPLHRRLSDQGQDGG